MNRDEILQRAQNEKSDEMEIQIRDKSLKWTYITMVVVAAVFAFIRGMNNKPMMDLCVTVCASVCAGQIYRFIKTKDRGCLMLAVVSFIISVVALIRFLMGH